MQLAFDFPERAILDLEAALFVTEGLTGEAIFVQERQTRELLAALKAHQRR